MTFSVITVSYNSANTINDAIQSVLMQSFTDYEYIIVDGKSSDGTVNIIKKYSDKFHGRLVWISESDNGIYDAMNKAIRMAKGDIVGFLNSDDFFSSPDVLKRIYDAFDHNAIDAVYGDVHYVNAMNLKRVVRFYSSAYFKPSMIRAGYIPAHPSFYARREIYSKYGFFDTSFKVAADFDILLRFIYIHNIITLYLAMDFVTMRLGGASSSGITSHLRIMKEHFLSFKKNKVKIDYVRYFARYFMKFKEFVVYRDEC